MKENILDLIQANPNGLLKLQAPLSISEYRENFGFNLKNVWTIYQSKKISHTHEDCFSSPRQNLENIFQVKVEAEENCNLVVFIVETIKGGQVNCHLILKNEAYQRLLNDPTCHILQVHQMYKTGLFNKDHIALNTSIAKIEES